MNKKEFVDVLAEKLDTNASRANAALDIVFDTLVETLIKEGTIKLPWGVFSVVETKERKGRNPKTGDELVIPAKKKIKFRVSATQNKLLS